MTAGAELTYKSSMEFSTPPSLLFMAYCYFIISGMYFCSGKRQTDTGRAEEKQSDR